MASILVKIDLHSSPVQLLVDILEVSCELLAYVRPDVRAAPRRGYSCTQLDCGTGVNTGSRRLLVLGCSRTELWICARVED